MDSVAVDYGRDLVFHRYGGVRIMTPQDHASKHLVATHDARRDARASRSAHPHHDTTHRGVCITLSGRARRYVGEVSDMPPGTADTLAAWGLPSKGESRFPVLVVVAVAIFLQVILPDRLLVSGVIRILVPALEGLLLIVLLIANPGGIINPEQRRLRALGVTLIAFLSVANALSLIIL